MNNFELSEETIRWVEEQERIYNNLCDENSVMCRQWEDGLQDRQLEIYAPRYEGDYLMLTTFYYFGEINKIGAERFVEEKCNGFEYFAHHQEENSYLIDIVMRVNPEKIKDTMPYQYMISGNIICSYIEHEEDEKLRGTYDYPLKIYRVFKTVDEENKPCARMTREYYDELRIQIIYT